MNGPSDTWQTTLLPDRATVQDAIHSLERSAQQIVLVVDGDGVLIGTITDGDIRRGMLRGIALNEAISNIVHRDPMVLPHGLDRQAALQLMRSNRVQQLPVIDEHRHVVGLHLLNSSDTPEERENTIFIMAGGRGTRLHPHTENCPKPMLRVGGKPMLEHIIDRARAEGFRHFVLAVNYLGHMIEDYFSDGSDRGVSIEYLREQQPLGTGGALGLIKDRPAAPFLVTNGDVLSEVRYGEILDFHVRHGAVATMAVRSFEWQHPFGVVHTDGVDITRFEEKPIMQSRINAGIYALNPIALDGLRQNQHCDMPTLFEQLQASARRTIVFPMHEAWLDVGRPADLDHARTLQRDPRPRP